jgi:ubiquitin-conjugating enzyme E2 Q
MNTEPRTIEEDEKESQLHTVSGVSNETPSNHNNNAAATIEIPVQEVEDEESEYEYEDDDDAPFVSGFLIDSHPLVTTLSSATAETNKTAAPAKIEMDEPNTSNTTSSLAATTGATTWREPSRAAVNMSLRVEKETKGGKRRLLQDLYRIMNQDTFEAGFSLEPTSEDSMEKWTIKLFKFDEDSNLAKDMLVLNLESIQLELTFPEQYPFEPPFVRVVSPRFKKQTGFVMNGALCMELLTKDGWNPVNDIESVIVSIRSLLVVGDGRLEGALNLGEAKYNALLAKAEAKCVAALKPAASTSDEDVPSNKRQRANSNGDSNAVTTTNAAAGAYTVSEAQAAYSHLSDYHKKKGWDSNGWWARKG